MKTESLIHQLALHAEPVKPIGSPISRLLLWTLVSVLLVLAGVELIGPSDDLVARFGEPCFFFQVLLTTGAGIFMAAAALILSVPGRGGRRLKYLALVAAVLWPVYIGCAVLLMNGGRAGEGVNCVRNLFVLCLLPGLLLVWSIRKAAPMDLRTAGLLIGSSACLLAISGVQLICRNSDPMHVLVWHVTPVLILMVVALSLGPLILASSHSNSAIRKTPESPFSGDSIR